MYIDTLIRIKNAMIRKKDRVKVPYSQLEENVLESLVKTGYLNEVQKKGRGVKRVIEIKLKYNKEEKSRITNIKLISRPSKRVYVGWKDIKKSHQGYGNFFLSTPKGIMVDKEARRNRLGGELLFEIW